ncbi:MAG: MBL fold metallo-hydrolase [Defluviitaleaceae bacterium]|nr:MBL fold metallo-hydrolase [Defluviitaleaceae bacterium]
MKDWFTTERIDENTYVISEYGHQEETHMYLLNGNTHSLLIDTGLGVCSIYDQVMALTDKPIIAVATHIHWDHIGNHRLFNNFYAHEAELPWLTGHFPLPTAQIKTFLANGLKSPHQFDLSQYQLFQGTPTKLLHDNEAIDLGNRALTVLHTPGHSPGHMCFWEARTGYLFTGDLVYMGTLFASFPSTDPKQYQASIERVANLPVKKVFPGHHNLNVAPAILGEIKNAFSELEADQKLHHGSGTHYYTDFAIQL